MSTRAKPKEMHVSGPLDPSKLAIAYIRVSMAREVMVSPEQQLFACQNWADIHGITIVDVVYDLDESGRQFAKRKVGQIIERVREKEAKYALVWKYSRWGRNSAAAQAHLGLLRGVGGQLISATEQVDVSTSTGRYMERSILNMDELYSDLVGDGWRDTIARRKRAQLPANGRPRFGYKRCDDCKRNPENSKRYLYCETCKGVLQPDPVVGPVLAHCYEMYVDGHSFNEISHYVRLQGIRSADGNLISETGMIKIMDTGFAAGLVCFLPEENRVGEKRNRHISQLDWYEGKHERLIQPDLWEKYKARRLSTYQQKPAEIYAAYALTGLLRCGRPVTEEQLCMSVMLGKARGNGWTDFGCRVRTDLRACKGTNCRHDRALDTVREWVLGMASDSRTATMAMKHAAARTRAQDALAELKIQRDRAATRRGRLVDGYAEGIISKEDYLDRKEEADAEIETLDTQILELGGTVASKIPMPKEFQGLAAVWDKLTPHELNEALKQVISYIVVHPADGFTTFPLPTYTIVPRWEAAPITKLKADHTNRVPMVKAHNRGGGTFKKR